MAKRAQSREEEDIHVELLALSHAAKKRRDYPEMYDVIHQGIDRELDALDKIKNKKRS